MPTETETTMDTELTTDYTAPVYVVTRCDCEVCARTPPHRIPSCKHATLIASYDCMAWSDEPHIPTASALEELYQMHPGARLVHF